MHTNKLLSLLGNYSIKHLRNNMSYIKSLFTLKKPPEASKIQVSDNTHKKATSLLYLGILILFVSFFGSLVKTFFFSGLKASVNEFNFFMLLLSILILIISCVVSFIKLSNAHTDILSKSNERPSKVVQGAFGSLLISVYFSFFTINEAGLAGMYNEGAYQNICKVYGVSGEKSNTCIDYEEDMAIDKSPIARALYFYDFKK